MEQNIKAAICPRKYKDIIVNEDTIYADDTYAGYPYRADIPLSEATSQDIPEITFGLTDIESENYAPVAQAQKGVVSFYMKEIPLSGCVRIPYIELH